jgi:hypothetical protein
VARAVVFEGSMKRAKQRIYLKRQRQIIKVTSEALDWLPFFGMVLANGIDFRNYRLYIDDDGELKTDHQPCPAAAPST